MPNYVGQPITNVAEEICYKRNYLTQVIVRVDFLNSPPGFDKQLPQELITAVSKPFPIPEPKTTIAKEFQISPSGIKETLNKQIQEWRFHGLNRDKTLTITPEAIFIIYKVYESYETLRKEFTAAFSKINEITKVIQSKRIGLRYINNIRLQEDNPLDWTKYINSNLLHTFNFSEKPEELTRAFNDLEYSFGDFNLRYQFGLFNPDYPALIKQKLFVMDFDAYYQSVLEYQEIVDSLQKFHSKIQDMFEKSITNDLRKIMNEK